MGPTTAERWAAAAAEVALLVPWFALAAAGLFVAVRGRGRLAAGSTWAIWGFGLVLAGLLTMAPVAAGIGWRSVVPGQIFWPISSITPDQYPFDGAGMLRDVGWLLIWFGAAGVVRALEAGRTEAPPDDAVPGGDVLPGLDVRAGDLFDR